MINRRLIRIKTVQVLYAHLKSGDRSLSKTENDLFHSIKKSYELYHLFFQLIVEYSHLAELKIDRIENAHIADKNEKLKYEPLVNSMLVQQIVSNSALSKYMNDNSVSWSDNQDFVKASFKALIESAYYQDFLNSDRSYLMQKKLFVSFMEDYLLNSDDLERLLEDKSIFLNDDTDFMLSMVFKTFRRMDEQTDKLFPLLPMFKDDSDRDFAKNLIRKAVVDFNKYDGELAEQMKNWKLERLADIDLIAIKLAIIEAIEFPSVPLKVTLNEYIDIVKYYSTEKSNVFVNGILETMFSFFQQNKIIVKKGRGLLE